MTGRELLSDARGAVQLEFMLALVPLVLLFVGLTQLVLLQVAQLIVQHAAERGARSAAVLLNDTAADYGGAPPGQITDAKNGRPSARLRAVVRVVHAPLGALAPHPLARLRAMTGAQSVADALRGGPEAMALASALDAFDERTAVSFPVSPGAEEVHRGRVPLKGDIHLRVRHELDCLVPIARRLMCEPAPGLEGGSRRTQVLQGEASFPSQFASYDQERIDGR